MWKNDDAESGMFTKNPACWNCYEKKTACSNKNRHVELKSGMLKIRQKNGMCLHRSFCWWMVWSWLWIADARRHCYASSHTYTYISINIHKHQYFTTHILLSLFTLHTHTYTLCLYLIHLGDVVNDDCPLFASLGGVTRLGILEVVRVFPIICTQHECKYRKLTRQSVIVIYY